MATQTAIELEDYYEHDHDRQRTITRSLHRSQTSFPSVSPVPWTPPTSAHAHEPTTTPLLEPRRAVIVMIQLASINFMTSFTNGLITVALPTMAASLPIEQSLLLWPASAYFLTSGTCLLLAGTLTDVIGARTVNLTGCFFIAIFTLAQGFAHSGIQLIMFRAMQGIALALEFPSSVSIISTSIETGKRRNIGFATLGLAQPLGFSFGLVIGGLLLDGLGWRSGFYIAGGISFVLFTVGIWALPAGVKTESEAPMLHRLRKDIDWVGALIASASLAILSYVLSALGKKVENIKRPYIISILTVGILLLPAFAVWMGRQEKLGRPALIPNSLWRKLPFSTICVMVLLSYAVVNCMELYSSLFFQEIQNCSALQTSLRILPNLLVGVALNMVIGTFVNRVPAVYAVLVSSGLCVGAPLLMAVINPKWPYWWDAFFAQALSPLSVDILFTVGLLVVSDVFPDMTQALAGAVFNTVAQLGSSIGLTTTSVISQAVTKGSRFQYKESPAALMAGYRAAFWTLFAWMVAACVVGGFGLRKLGRVGQKRD